MRVTIGDICRGTQKIFAKCTVEEAPQFSELTLSAKTKEGAEVPSLVFEDGNAYTFRGSSAADIAGSAGELTYVICLPIIEAQGYTLDFSALDVEGNAVASCTEELSSLGAKWQSRLNYRLHASEAKHLRDFDQEAAYDKCRLSLQDAINDLDHVILNGSVEMPWRDNNELELTCYTQDLREVPLELTIMGNTCAPGLCPEGSKWRQISFSTPFPLDLTHYLFVMKDLNNPELNSFETLEDYKYTDMQRNTFELMRHARIDPSYPDWFENHRAKLGRLREQATIEFAYQPLFSIIVPLFNTPISFFNDMVASVTKQSYKNWELVLVNATPDNAELCAAANTAAQAWDNIKLVTLEGNLGISGNTNKGIEAATGDFICFFDHDDVLEPNILFEYASALNKYDDIDLLYCDEDKLLEDGTLAEPFFKPDFNIDLLRNSNYICHMLTIRKSLLDTIEPNTAKYDGAQDHNLTLRAVEKARYVHHVSQMLYHWRVSANSTASTPNTKSYASDAGILAVKEHLERCGPKAKVGLSRRAFTYQVIYDVPDDHPLVSIIIPNKDHIDLLGRCLDSIFEKSTYDNFEVVIIENNSTESETFEYYKSLAATYGERVRTVTWGGEFNFSKLMNFGRANARGSYLLLLNNDTEVITPNWIEIMLGLAAREDVGAVGVRLFYPNDTIQHAGVCITGIVAVHMHKNVPRDINGYTAFNDAQQDMSAVTAACIMSSVEAFDAVGGFTEELTVAFNDIDYCLKLRELGKLVVYTPEVELYHYESVSRGYEDNKDKRMRFDREIAYMREHWAKYYVEGDPYLNKNFVSNEPIAAYYHL